MITRRQYLKLTLAAGASLASRPACCGPRPAAGS
jgi:hypothetical protein